MITIISSIKEISIGDHKSGLRLQNIKDIFFLSGIDVRQVNFPAWPHGGFQPRFSKVFSLCCGWSFIDETLHDCVPVNNELLISEVQPADMCVNVFAFVDSVANLALFCLF